MTTSAIAVTEGSGKNIWTDQRSVSSVNREAQYVLPAEPNIPTYVAHIYNVGMAANGDTLVQLMSGASTYTRVHRITVQQATAATTAYVGAVQLVRLTSAGTGGTAITPSPMDTADTANAAARHTIGTATAGTATIILETHRMYMGAGTAERDSWTWEPVARGKPLVIPSGTTNGIAIKHVSATVTGSYDVSIYFSETAWL